MANNAINELGLTKSKFKQAKTSFQKIQQLKSDETNSKQDNGDDFSSFDYFLYEKLNSEKTRSENLQAQLNDLTSELKTISANLERLNNQIEELKKENKNLNDLLKKEKSTNAEKSSVINKNKQKNQTNSKPNSQKNSPNKTPKKNATNTQTNEPNATNKQSSPAQSSTTTRNEHTDAEKSSGSSNESEHGNDNNFTENEKIKRTNNIPPIDVWTSTQDATQQIIRYRLPQYSCTFSKINKTKMRVFPKSLAIRKRLIELLNESKINFNTYTPADEKMQNILLKGTEISDERVISDALNKNGIEPYKIQRFETGYMRKSGIQSNIWQIVLLPKTDVKSIFNIKYVAEWSVKWQVMRKPTIVQCKRCQRLNHSASNCTLPYRCVKCTESHEPGKCPSDNKTNKTKPQCVNCNGEHTANNATLCPYFKKEMKLREERKQNKNGIKPGNRANTANTAPMSVNSSNGASYANITREKNTAPPKQPTSQQPNANLIIEMFKESQQAMREMFDRQNQMLQIFLQQNGK